MKKLWLWLVKSSEDPQALALTVKGFLVGLVPLLMLLSPAVGLDLSADDFQGVAGDVASIVQNVLGALGLVISAYGFARKVLNTFWK